MYRWLILLISAMTLSVVLGCSGGDKNPILTSQISPQGAGTPAPAQTHLWGLYDIHMDIPSKTVDITPNRTADFTANVVNFLNSKPANLSFHINATVPNADSIDVDIDVSITHPFPGLSQYDGYDVRGVFMGDGSATLEYNPDLIYPVLGSDQYMLDDIVDGVGGPDGYTRWFNKAEFSEGGMPLFQYTQGAVASPGFNGSATLCPYKYFADGLDAEEDLWTWLAANGSMHGKFSSGAKNTRNYYLRFPNSKGIKFGYAVLASWKGTGSQDHPANAPEAVAVNAQVTPDLYYVDPGNKGGELILDLDVFDWDSHPSGGVMTDYNLIIESTVLTAPATFSDMTPTGGGEYYSTYHVEITADNLNVTEGNEFWVIVEDQNLDYTNPYSVPNLAGSDKLAAIFRFDLEVDNSLENTPPTITGITDDISPDGLNTTVGQNDTAVTYIVNYDDPDVGQDHDIKWYIEDGTATDPSDPPDAMPYNWAPKSPGSYKIWVKVDDGFGDVTSGPYSVARVSPGWARTWGGPYDWDEGWDVAIDDSGNIYVSGMFKGTVDFDPGAGTDNHSSTGGVNYFDAFMSKFNPNGDFVWARTWGGTNEDWAKSVAISGSYLYVSGYFRTTVGGEQVDFDPDPTKTTYKTSYGDRDAFISRFDLDGTFSWVQTWGSPNYEWGGEDLVCDTSANVYSLGWNEGPWRIDLRCYNSSGVQQWAYTWLNASVIRMEDITLYGSNLYFTGLVAGSNLDFDPGSGTTSVTTAGSDAILCCFSTAGALQWVKNWGLAGCEIWAQSVACDPSGNVYIGGTFTGTNVDFDPGSGTEYHSSLDGMGNRDCFLTRFDGSGNHDWAKTWGGSGNEDWTRGVACDSAGNAYAVGYYRSSTVNLDPDGSDIRTNAGGMDVFFSKFDSTGDYIWGRNIGGSSWDYGNDIMINGGSIFFTGAFSSYNMDFDPGSGTDLHSTHGSEDIFLSSISTDGYW